MECDDADVIALLNPEEEKENNQESNKPDLNDLLCITNAAVQGLDRPGRHRECENNRPLATVQPLSFQFTTLSPTHLRDLYGDGEFADNTPGVEVERENHIVTPENTKTAGVTATAQNDSIGSKSSTASEILIRATTPREVKLKSNLNDGNRGPLNDSVSSRGSASEAGISGSGFITGQAKKVKVSSKKLKEIKSPFESFLSEEPKEFNLTDCQSAPGLSQVEPPIIDINVMSSGSVASKYPKQVMGSLISQSHNQSNKSPLSNSTSSNLNAVKYPQNVHVECHVPGETITDFLANKKMYESSVSECSNASDQQVYRDFKNDVIITDVHGSSRNQTMNESRTSSMRTFNPGLMATTSSKIIAETASTLSSKTNFGFTDTGSMFIEDVIAGAGTDTETPSVYSEESIKNPEIMTIPQSVVTITAQDGLNGINTTDSDTSAENYPLALQDRFGKYRPSGVLRQGAPVEGTDPHRLPLTSDSDVTVTQYSLSEKQRLLRNNFMKRTQSQGPVKRVVQPKVIQPAVTVSSTQSMTSTNVDPVTTAAVAASAAVAATQPFLRAQQDVEHRMTEILEKLSNIQSTNPSPPPTGLGNTGTSGMTGVSGVTVGSLGEGSSTGGRIGDLEKQLQDLTQRRLDYLEKMNEKQMMVQAQLLSISRQPGGSSSGPDTNQPSNWPSDSRWRPSVVTKPNQTKSVTEDGYRSKNKNRDKEEREVSVLDTPAPRRKPPTPMSFDGTGSSDMKSPPRSPRRSKTKSPKSKSPSSRKHRSPAREKKKAFGLLQEILSSQDETPRHSPFASTPPDSFHSTRSRTR